MAQTLTLNNKKLPVQQLSYSTVQIILEVFFFVLISDQYLSSTSFELVLRQFAENFKVGCKANIKAAFVDVIISVTQHNHVDINYVN